MAFPNDEQIKFVIMCLAEDKALTLSGLLAAMPDEFPDAIISGDRIERLLTQLCERNLLTEKDGKYFKGSKWLKFMNYAAEIMIGDDRDQEAVIAFQDFESCK